MTNQIKKISTIARKSRENNPGKYETFRDEILTMIVKSNPNMNVHVTITTKPF